MGKRWNTSSNSQLPLICSKRMWNTTIQNSGEAQSIQPSLDCWRLKLSANVDMVGFGLLSMDWSRALFQQVNNVHTLPDLNNFNLLPWIPETMCCHRLHPHKVNIYCGILWLQHCIWRTHTLNSVSHTLYHCYIISDIFTKLYYQKYLKFIR